MYISLHCIYSYMYIYIYVSIWQLGNTDKKLKQFYMLYCECAFFLRIKGS